MRGFNIARTELISLDDPCQVKSKETIDRTLMNSIDN